MVHELEINGNLAFPFSFDVGVDFGFDFTQGLSHRLRTSKSHFCLWTCTMALLGEL